MKQNERYQKHFLNIKNSSGIFENVSLLLELGELG